MEITFLFPINYRHGCPSSICYKEVVKTLGNSHKINIHTIFSQTDLYIKLKHFSFDPYIRWVQIEKGLYIAESRIQVSYRNKSLFYFHNPSTKEVIFDFKMIHNISLKIPKIEKGLINSSKLEGDYFIDLTDYNNSKEIETESRDIFE